MQSWKDKFKKIKKDSYTLYFAYNHPKTPKLGKVIAALAVFYFLSPIDLIPDFIPILGYLDDLIILPILISISFKLIPENILKECKAQVEKNPHPKKNNKVAAFVIILIWCFLTVFIFKLLKKLVY